MRRFFRGMLVLALFLNTACAMAPKVRPVTGPAAEETARRCDAVFPDQPWRWVHAIEAGLPDGGSTLLIGAAAVDPGRGAFTCVLMSVEGAVLLEASYDGETKVARALGPLARKGVAEGMVEDFRLMFFKPAAVDRTCGRIGPDQAACRYAVEDGRTVDVLPGPGDGWRLRAYDRFGVLRRSVAASPPGPQSGGKLPEKLVLEAPGPFGYTLVMRLVEAEAGR